METAFPTLAQWIQNHRNQPMLIAVDGRCASGKTTLASALERETGCNVIHMDHFFLRPEQRTKQRLEEPGGNVDYERFQEDNCYRRLIQLSPNIMGFLRFKGIFEY